MSRNILLTKIDTEIEKINNLVAAGHLEDVRRARLASHGEQLEDIKKRLKLNVGDEQEIEQEFIKLKESAESI